MTIFLAIKSFNSLKSDYTIFLVNIKIKDKDFIDTVEMSISQKIIQ